MAIIKMINVINNYLTQKLQNIEIQAFKNKPSEIFFSAMRTLNAHKLSISTGLVALTLAYDFAKNDTAGSATYYSLWTASALNFIFSSTLVSSFSYLGLNNLVSFLLRSGVDCNQTPLFFNISPLIAACLAYRPEMVKFLIDAGADITNTTNGKTPLHNACELGQSEIAQLLLQASQDKGILSSYIDTPTSFGNTALHLSCERNSPPEISQLLIDAGADITKQNNLGFTPLAFACAAGNMSAAKLLILKAHQKRLPLIHTPALGWNTPLHHACTLNDNELVELLLSVGANVNLPNLSRETPLFLACKENNINNVKSLIRAGANFNIADINGQTPLQYARQHNLTEIAKELTDAGAV